ncbi:MAG: hypothetical protein S4CHLAM123_08540 [Chlamydiales bacterium]|nr:hypothetical protein [Chlamydiales bacterium]
MKLEALSQSIQQYIPSREQVVGRFSISPPQIARQLNRIAIPAIGLYAAYNAPGVDAGFLLAGVTYVGTNLLGGAMVVVGTVTAPVGGAPLAVAGVAVVTAAPATLLVTLPAPTP